jgi:hypothetical protein
VLARLPDDPAIPLLDAIARQGLDSVLASVDIRDGVLEVDLISHTVGSRCSFRVQTPRAQLLVKGYADDPHELVDLFMGFQREGLASGKGPTVAPLEGASRSLRCLVTTWLDGPSASDLIRNGQGKRAGVLAAAWLRRTAELPLVLGRPYSSREVLVEARSWVTRIGSADGELAEQASACLDRLSAMPPTDVSPAVRHGSFVPRHVLDLQDGPGVIDWDSFCVGALEVDAGLYLAACSRMGTRSGLGEAAAMAADAFRDALEGSVAPARLRWYQGAGMLRLSAYLAGRRPADWQARCGLLLDETGALLA